MLSNYLSIALRNILKFRLYSFINIFGLAIGIASFILIFSYFRNEISYDNYHKNADCIFQIYRIENGQNGKTISGVTPGPLAEALRNDYPDLLKAASISSERMEIPLRIGNNNYKEEVFEADEDLFSMFNFTFLKGDAKGALKNPSSAVITEDFAKKYFGNEEALGKTLTLLNKYDFVISGIIKKIPANSNIQFRIAISSNFMNQLSPEHNKQWHSSGKFTFVKLNNPGNVTELKNNLVRIRDKYLPEFLKGRMDFGIIPITDVHLSSDLHDELIPPVSKMFLYSLLGIALAVLAIASINFMNITIARYSERVNETGMRKVLGAGNLQIILQFLCESVLLSLVALSVGITLAEIFLPEFNKLTDKSLEIFNFNFSNIIQFLGFGLAVGVITGLYPAIVYSLVPATKMFKEFHLPGSNIYSFRKLLIMVQFTISIILITCILIVNRQISFMKNYNLGFNKENIIVVPLNSAPENESENIVSKMPSYINSIKQGNVNTGILDAALSEHTPGYYYNNIFGVIPEGSDRNHPLEMVVTSVDDNFLRTYNVPITEGRGFSTDYGSDSYGNILINKAAMNKMGWKTAVGKKINFVHGEGPFTVVGVINDIHFKSLLNQVEPLVIRYAGNNYLKNFLSVRIKTKDISETLKYLKESWSKILPGVQFEYFFVEDKYNEAYRAQERIEEIIGVFAIVAAILACLGLFGLTALLVRQKTKEVGIRKVLGASFSDIVIMISKQFINIILLANLVAWPVSYLLMKHWLEAYPYRISISVFFFIASGVIILIIASLTIAFQSVKTALLNPVNLLRYE